MISSFLYGNMSHYDFFISFRVGWEILNLTPIELVTQYQSRIEIVSTFRNGNTFQYHFRTEMQNPCVFHCVFRCVFLVHVC
jgi:hypothetical protein